MGSMKVVYGIGKVGRPFKNTVLAIGVFDGVHRGHQQLISRAVAEARACTGTSVVLTFHPHPVSVVHPRTHILTISSLEHRLFLLEQLGVDVCIVVHFVKRFAALTPEKFIKRYLIAHLHPRTVFVGDDFRFGKNRTGTLDYFSAVGREHGFSVSVVHPLKGVHDGKISSTDIRACIIAGNLDCARRLLGRAVCVMGKVERGARRGRTLGFPTANIYPDHQAIPPQGVYIVNVFYAGSRYQGMASVGYPVSFSSGHQPAHIEVHMFDFRGALYGKYIRVEFVKKYRENRYFPSKEALIAQLQSDEAHIRAYLSRHT
jgi:riboflavin kinase / FMN adenylyltransferase